MIAPKPLDEEARLTALAETGLLDTPPEPDFDQIVKLAALVCEMPISLITLVDEDRQWFKSNVGFGLPETSRDVAFCAHAILQPDMFLVPDAVLDPRFAQNPLVTGDPSIRFYAGIPLAAEGHNIGTLCVIDREPRKLTTTQESALRVLANQVMTQIELRRQLLALQVAVTERDRVTRELRHSQGELTKANELLRQLAVIDGLTGLINRRHLDERLAHEFNVSRRNDTPLSVLLLDLDHFKAINDTLGHEAGDKALIHLSRELEKLFRRTDVIARYGGEEFVVLLPNTDEAAAMQLAWKVCWTVEAMPKQGGKGITVSIGVATTGAAIEAPKDLMALADRGLYAAKDAGRNTCVRTAK
jgi:diguanylate cyclase (GGDEF)-like protein